MTDFLSESDICGQTILRLVSRGSAIIAELQRLSEHIPPVFYPGEQSEYQNVIKDFSYLKEEDEYEKKIQSSQKLLDLDEEFRDNYMDLLERFYVLFEAIYKYVQDFLKYLTDIETGVFIQQTYESILINQDGKQLLSEALYLYGCMLLLMDIRIDGAVRERMLISYLRYKGSSASNFDEVCKLCRNTGFSMRGKYPGIHPHGYPEEYFARVSLPAEVVKMIIGRLRSDDIYQMAFNYPKPDHRSTALSTQAAMLYVLLYFQPDILKNQQSTMREIVDKHFPDNWIINWYMGYYVDLSVVWYPYKAANKAIDNILQPDNLKLQTTRFTKRMSELNVEIKELLIEGVLTEDYVLDNITNKLLPVVRDCNVTLRWLILHSTCSGKKVKDIVKPAIKYDEVLELLLETAQLEFILKEMFHELLKEKRQKWETAKEEGVSKMNAISEYFAGEGVLAAENKEDQFQSYFSSRAESIDELDYHDTTLAGRKITGLIQALESVEQFEQVYGNLQVRQYLMDICNLLRKMLRYVNIKEKVPITIATVGDLSYAWSIIGNYVPLMQDRIKKNPSKVLQLRSTFLKLATMLELPLTRIMEANSPDLASVSQYYSESLVSFVRKVLDIIPVSMFEVLNDIIQIQTNQLKECPTKIARNTLTEYAQLDARYELAQKTHKVSKFTEGILAMEKTLMGVIQVDPHKLLEEGVRKELVQQISKSLHHSLQFSDKKKHHHSHSHADALVERMTKLAILLNGMKSSFEYLQDYMCVYGLKIWQEEFSRIVNYNVEQECCEFLKKKVFDWDSQYQSDHIPIPKFDRLDDLSVNFMGRLLREIQHQTDSKKTTYVDQLASWYNESGKEVIGLRTFSLLRDSMGVIGLNGLDKLLCFMSVRDIQTFVGFIRKNLLPAVNEELVRMSKDINPPETIPKHARRWYEGSMVAKLSKQWFPVMLEITMRIGRNQLLRRHLAGELRFTCKLDSNTLYCALQTFNQSMLEDINSHYRSPNDYPYPDRDNNILSEMTSYLEASGISHPFTKVYTTAESIEHIPLVLFLLVISVIGRFAYEPEIDTLTCRKKDDPLDGVPFIVGVLTILKQFHSEHKECFVAYLAQYIRVMVYEGQRDEKKKDDNLFPEVVNALHFLEAVCKLAPLDRKVVENQVPPCLFAQFKPERPQKKKK